MSNIISQEFINELISRSNIIDIINSHISLKKVGNNFKTYCPFHQEKTPSFTVNYDKQFYYCFGCNAHGNIIDFLITYEKLSFIESIEKLSNIHGLPIQYSCKQNTNIINYKKQQNLYLLIQTISNLYHDNIFKTKIAHEYLINRGINQEMIKLFNIGFANINLKNINAILCSTYDCNQQDLINLGILTINKQGKIYNQLDKRITFPIKNKNGKVVGFGGRSINTTVPKYLNSPESNIFSKKKQLYGLYEILKKNIKPRIILIVEGYIDVITLTQFNIIHSVSPLGTFISNEQIESLFRITNTIICCFDGDIAGKKAAWRTLKLSLSYILDGKNIKFIFLPKSEDPDSIIRKEGSDKFKKRIDQSIELSEFLFYKLFKNVDLSLINEKSYFCIKAINLINQIPGKITKIYLFQILGNKVGIPDQNILRNITYHNNKIVNYNYPIIPFKKRITFILIGLLIQNPSLAKLAKSSLKYLKHSNILEISIFLNLIKNCNSIHNCNTGTLLELYRNTRYFEKLKYLAKLDYLINETQIKTFFLDSLNKIYNTILENRYNILISKERKIGLNKIEKNELWSINKKLTKL